MGLEKSGTVKGVLHAYKNGNAHSAHLIWVRFEVNALLLQHFILNVNVKLVGTGNLNSVKHDNHGDTG